MAHGDFGPLPRISYHGLAHRRQLDKSALLQFDQEASGSENFEPSPGRAPAPDPAELFCQTVAAPVAVPGCPAPQPIQIVWF